MARQVIQTQGQIQAPQLQVTANQQRVSTQPEMPTESRGQRFLRELSAAPGHISNVLQSASQASSQNLQNKMLVMQTDQRVRNEAQAQRDAEERARKEREKLRKDQNKEAAEAVRARILRAQLGGRSLEGAGEYIQSMIETGNQEGASEVGGTVLGIASANASRSMIRAFEDLSDDELSSLNIRETINSELMGAIAEYGVDDSLLSIVSPEDLESAIRLMEDAESEYFETRIGRQRQLNDDAQRSLAGHANLGAIQAAINGNPGAAAEVSASVRDGEFGTLSLDERGAMRLHNIRGLAETLKASGMPAERATEIFDEYVSAYNDGDPDAVGVDGAVQTVMSARNSMVSSLTTSSSQSTLHNQRVSRGIGRQKNLKALSDFMVGVTGMEPDSESGMFSVEGVMSLVKDGAIDESIGNAYVLRHDSLLEDQVVESNIMATIAQNIDDGVTISPEMNGHRITQAHIDDFVGSYVNMDVELPDGSTHEPSIEERVGRIAQIYELPQFTHRPLDDASRTALSFDTRSPAGVADSYSKINLLKEQSRHVYNKLPSDVRSSFEFAQSQIDRDSSQNPFQVVDGEMVVNEAGASKLMESLNVDLDSTTMEMINTTLRSPDFRNSWESAAEGTVLQHGTAFGKRVSGRRLVPFSANWLEDARNPQLFMTVAKRAAEDYVRRSGGSMHGMEQFIQEELSSTIMYHSDTKSFIRVEGGISTAAEDRNQLSEAMDSASIVVADALQTGRIGSDRASDILMDDLREQMDRVESDPRNYKFTFIPDPSDPSGALVVAVAERSGWRNQRWEVTPIVDEETSQYIPIDPANLGALRQDYLESGMRADTPVTFTRSRATDPLSGFDQ